MLAIEKVPMVQCRVLWQHWKRYYREDKLDELIPIFPVWNIFSVFQERLQHLDWGFERCSASGSGSSSQTQSSDMQYVKDKGTLVVGITEFEPMDYQDTDGNWIGFDADMATAFAEYLGVEVEFQVIDWDSKIMELDGKTIDVAWNGMTLTEDVKAAMECSNPYFNNAQVVHRPR